MSRYFKNPYKDYKIGEDVIIDAVKWKDKINMMLEPICGNMPPTRQHCDGGLYVGNAGIAYMFYHLAQNRALAAQRPMFLESALKYIKVACLYEESTKRDKASFLLGEAGVAATAALITSAIGGPQDQTTVKHLNRFVEFAKICKPVNFLRCGSDELFVGRAGYLCGVMNLHKKLGRKVVSDADVQELCSVTLQSGRNYTRNNPAVPLMYAYYNTEYLGAAHGLSSILQMLLSFPAFIKSSADNEATLRAGVDFMLSLEQPNHNWPPAMDEVHHRRPDSEELVHWCHGSPGVVYMFARAYCVWGDNRYLEACLRCGDLTWQRGLLRKGPGICHGVAGSGYVFLLNYRLSGDKKHLYRAQCFADFLFNEDFQDSASLKPDNPWSLYEGWAGAVCFLADLLQPDNAQFPFFDVFLE